MTETRRVGIYGTGKAAGEIVRAVASSPHTLTTAIAFFDEQAGQDIGVLTGGAPVGVLATTDLEGVVRSGDFEVLLYAGLSGDVLYKTMALCADAGVDMVHACFAHPRLRLPPEMHERLQERAAATGSRIVGTGMLPGFWLDVLPSLLTSALPAPVSIVGQACSDITSWGAGVLADELGLGRPPEDGVGPIGGILQESAEMIAEVLGLGGVKSERRGGFVIAEAATEVAGIQVSPGDRVGFDESAVVLHDGKERVRLGWTGLPGGSFEGFERALLVTAIGGDGTEIVIDVTNPLDPYPGTAARFVHAIRGVQPLPGGLHTPVKLSI
ncbi:hypothetical protein CAI21_14265 [Alkalilimnicola ehrlichii]|uniref:Uncharacterized protein n=1 Tax=Alkalilimnicola ehrlichii TaxID=351052 RepID=A0A3E0WKU4_9GAMM|nr:hypothetical protein [Alkalilimnicola ehrlichii]RFA27774.1 hypothetical protein CAI21_14265 [Alkalilimnicola ehrlichii]RFA33580.1 hypothetical protein CAL65_17155 [Alkalilimnicola ehrlichii]